MASFGRRHQHQQLHKRQSGLVPTMFDGFGEDNGNAVSIPPVTVTRGGRTITLFPTETRNPITRDQTTTEETTIAAVGPPAATTLATTSSATSSSSRSSSTLSSSSSSSSSTSASSTTSSTSISSTSSASPTSTFSSFSTSSSAEVAIPTSSASKAAPQTQGSTVVHFQTDTAYVTKSVSATRAAASQTQTQTGSHGLGAGATTGFAVAGVIGGLCLLAAVWFLIKRCRSRTDDGFDPDAFRRKSQALRDDDIGIAPPPLAQSEFNSSPRPPTMIQRHMNNTPPIFRPTPQAPYGHPPSPGPFAAYATYPEGNYGNNDGMYNNNNGHGMAGRGAGMPPSPGAYYAYGGQAYGPGDTIFSVPATATMAGGFPLPPTTPGTPTNAYSQNIAIGAGGGSMFAPDAYNIPLGSPTVSDTHTDGRHESVQSGAGLIRRTTVASLKSDEHYVDLDRSSVSPYQAQQYAEIQRKLSAPVPALQINSAASIDVPAHGAPVSKASEFTNYGVTSPGLGVSIPKEGALPESPFTDPAFAHKISIVNEHDDDDDELVEPHAAFSRTERIPSMPPMLPEVQRSFSPVVYDFPASVSGASETKAPAPVARAPIPAPAPAVAVVQPAAPAAQVKRPDTVYTMYDPEDAYGGI